MTREIYETADGTMRIVDPELNLDLEENYVDIRIPEKAKEGESLPGGYTIKTLHVVPHVGRIKKGAPDQPVLEEVVDAIYLEKEGKMEGQSCLFYPDGALRSSTFYQGGCLHGPSVYFQENGDVLSQSYYVNGKLEGKVHQFYTNGQLASLQRFICGKSEGKQEYFYEDGTLKTTMHYCRGKLHGQTLLYSEHGKPKREINFENGEQKGVERLWDEKGTLAAETTFTSAFEIQESKRWHSNGQLAEHEYHHGPTKFDIRQWNIDGVLLREGVYDKDGIIFTHRLWDEKGNLRMEKKGKWTGEKLVWE